MHEVLVNRLGGLSLPRKSVVRLTDHPDMTLDVYRGRKTTIQQQQQSSNQFFLNTTSASKCYIINTDERRQSMQQCQSQLDFNVTALIKR